MTRIWIIVLGDIGRSPRMQYHTASLCDVDDVDSVHLIGCSGAAVNTDLEQYRTSGKLFLHYIPSMAFRWVDFLPRALQLGLKALFQFLTLFWMLLIQLPRPDVILLQLPPAIPTMVACTMAARRHKARLVFDWHNFAFTLMGINMGREHSVVRLAEWHEKRWGRSADAHLCVTKCMKEELAKSWNIDATVFYDRPPRFFKRSTVDEMHSLMQRLGSTLRSPVHPNDFVSKLVSKLDDINKENKTSGTICTVQNGNDGATMKRSVRPAIIVSSTSWTPDEDFSILLDALELYDSKALTDASLPRLLVFVTGKGPQREYYESRMQRLDLQKVAVRTVWLEPTDYPLLLGCSDLGISLHASSSGMDLPMKIVDMFGCELPVCALSYSCIDELVIHGKNGLLFQTSKELAAHLEDILHGFPENENSGPLHRLRAGIQESGFVRWDKAWQSVASSVILGNT